MGVDRIAHYTDFRGLLVPDPRLIGAGIDEAQSTLTQAGPMPGVPEPQSRTEMKLDSGGSQDASKALRLQTIRAGFAGAGKAGFAWRYGTTPDPLWRGWDAPTVVGDWHCARVISTPATSAVPTDGIRTITTSSGTIVSVYGTTETFPTSTDRVQASVRNVNSGAWSTVTVRTFGYLFGTGRSPHPSILALPSGRLLCFYYEQLQLGASAGDIQVGMSYSDDDGATWTQGATNCLPEAIPYGAAGSGAADYSRIEATAVGFGPGDDLVLVCGLRLADTNVGAGNTCQVLRQYGSSDIGSTFQLVAESTGSSSDLVGGVNPQIVTHGGGFLVFWVRTLADLVYCVRIGSAFEPITVAAPVFVSNVLEGGAHSGAGMVSGQQQDASDYGACMADDGTIYVVIADHNGARAHQCGTAYSTDGGATWALIGQSSVLATAGMWHIGGSAQVYPSSLSATWQRGRVVVVSHHTDGAGAGTYDKSIDVTYLGGPCTVTRRSYDGTGRIEEQTSDEVVYVPYADPVNVGWTAAGTGTGTQTGSAWNINTSGTTKEYYRAFTSALAEGVAVEFDMDCVTGGSSTNKFVYGRIRFGDGATYDYVVEVWIGPTAIRLRDVNGGVNIATPTVSATSGGIEIRLEVVNAEVRWWTRARSSQPDRAWGAQTGSASLVSGGGAVTNEVRWGHLNVTANSNWRRVTINGASWVGNITSAQSNPSGLHPRSFAPYPVHVDLGTTVTATDGPTLIGDTWNINTRYRYAASRVLPWVASSRRHGWRSTATTVHRIALDIQPNNEGVSHGASPLSAIAVLGSNWRTGALQGDTNGAGNWVTIGDPIDVAATMSSLKYVRSGNTIVADTGTVSAPFFSKHECAGWTVDLGGGKLRRVKSNSSGTWSTGGHRCRIILEGCDGSEPGSGTASMWPTEWVFVVRPNTALYAGYRLVIDAQSTVDNDLRVGTWLPGSVAVFGQDYDWGRVIKVAHNTVRTDAQDWTSTAKNYGPPRRAVDLTWAYVDETFLVGPTPTPDWTSSTTTGGAPGVATIADTVRALDGALRLCEGSKTPMVYLANIGKGPPDSQIINRRHLFIYGTAAEAFEMPAVIGTAGRNEAVSGSLTITELP